MTEQKFMYLNDDLKGVKGEKTITRHSFNLPMGLIEVLITLEKGKDNYVGEDYYNIYIIDEHFKIEVLNCLKLQEPKEITNKPLEFFSEKYCEFKAIEHYLWFKYGSGNVDKETVSSYSIEEHS